MNNFTIKKEIEIFFKLIVFLGVSIAIAPLFGTIPIVVVFVSLMCIAFYLSLMYSKIILNFKSFDDYVVVIGFICLFMVLSGLGVSQIVYGENALFWNVDNRFFATLAHTIIKYGDLNHSLEYSGSGAMYHAGPSWIAAGLYLFLGMKVNTSLFLILPIFFAFSINTSKNLCFLSFIVLFCLINFSHFCLIDVRI
jgi:hypothetical protein